MSYCRERAGAGIAHRAFGQLHLPGDSGSAVAFAELGDDDDVVKNRIGRHATFLQRHDKIIEVLDGRHVRGLAGKVFCEALQDRVVFAEGVGLLRVSIGSR